MVLRKFIFIISIFFVAQLSAQQVGTLQYTDSYGVNYFTNQNKATEMRFYVGSDVFRFLNQNQLSECATFIQDFLVAVGNTGSLAFQLDNRNVLNTPVQIHRDSLFAVGYHWTDKYLSDWNELLRSFPRNSLDSLATQIDDPFYLCELEKNLNQQYAARNHATRTALAMVVPTATIFPKMEDAKLNTKLYNSSTSIDFNEIMFQANLDHLKKAYCGPINSDPLYKVMALHITESIYGNASLSPRVKYGINKTTWLMQVPENDWHESSLAMFYEPDAASFEWAKKQVVAALTGDKTIENMFFYNKRDLEQIPAASMQLSVEKYQSYLQNVANSHFVLTIPEKELLVNDSVRLMETNAKSLETPIYMKPNSAKFASKQDSIQLEKIAMFLSINPSMNVAISGYARNSEYLKVEKEKKSEIIANYLEQYPDYKVSKRFDLSLVRSLTIYNRIIENHPQPEHIKCTGIIAKKAMDKEGMSKVLIIPIRL